MRRGESFEFRITKELEERMEIIRKHEAKTRGNDKMTNAVRAAIFYYSDKIISGEVK